MTIAFIRHGKTQGNLQRRYIGATDEPLCAQGAAQLACFMQKRIYPPVTRVYTSPMRRCVQTAQLLYPSVAQIAVPDLREQNFGKFEGRTWEELHFLPAYQRWIETAGRSEIPQGESAQAFFDRSRAAFAGLMENALLEGCPAIAVVAHGGVLMAVLSRFAQPKRDFYGWQTANGGGFLCLAKQKQWRENHVITLLQEIEGEKLA